ncbi:MAG: SURF1 family protein [Micrococcales bacterium]|nr:SURF1 family protein [Micrococcales bacterium]
MSDVLAVLRQPKWLGMLVALPLLMGLCLVAANWQYDRHERRSAQEQQLAAAERELPVPLAGVLGPAEDLPVDRQYTSVTVTGVYDNGTVLIRNRSLEGTPGLWVVSPLRSADGSTILVLRGWIESTRATAERPVPPAPPGGDVTVTGVLQPSEAQRGAGLLSNGEATSLSTAALCPEPTCYRAYLQAVTSAPADSVAPLPVTGPGLGPHLGYAGQWVIFFLLLPVGYVILLRREVKETRVAESAVSGSS